MRVDRPEMRNGNKATAKKMKGAEQRIQNHKSKFKTAKWYQAAISSVSIPEDSDKVDRPQTEKFLFLYLEMGVLARDLQNISRHPW